MRLEGTSRDSLVQPTCSEQSQLNQAVQHQVQLGFEYLHAGRLHDLSGQLLKFLNTLKVKNSVVNFKLFVSVAFCPVTAHH